MILAAAGAVVILFAISSLSPALGPRSTWEFSMMLVLIAPGNTTLTWICVSFNSECKPSVINLTAAFDAP